MLVVYYHYDSAFVTTKECEEDLRAYLVRVGFKLDDFRREEVTKPYIEIMMEN